eukprot:399124-Pyramimonas_sp.AAC.1
MWAPAAAIYRRSRVWLTCALKTSSFCSATEEHPPPEDQHKKYHPRPRSPLAMAYFDHMEELEEQLREEGTVHTESAFELLAAHRINAAIEKGEFENLPGTGKPLNQTEDYSHIEYKILKNANCAPEWIELGKEVQVISETLRRRITDILRDVDSVTSDDELASMRSRVKASQLWLKHESDIRKTIVTINQTIEKRNNKAPSSNVHLIPLCVERELDACLDKLKRGP